MDLSFLTQKIENRRDGNYADIQVFFSFIKNNE